jgi:hypothetical protein
MGCIGDSALVSAYESEVDEEEEEGAGVDLLSGVRVADGPLFSFSADLEAALMGLTIQVVAPTVAQQGFRGSGMFIPRIRIISISDPGSASNILSILTQTIGF